MLESDELRGLNTALFSSSFKVIKKGPMKMMDRPMAIIYIVNNRRGSGESI